MKSLAVLLNDWRASRAAMERVTANLPRIIGTEGVRVVKQNFKLQGYDSGFGIEAWEPRKAETDARYDKRYGVKGSVYNSASPILMQTRNLYNGVKYLITGRVVTVGEDLSLVPYAQKMNEGGPGTWGPYAKTETPARKYIPTPGEAPPQKLLTAVDKKVKFETRRALLPFYK